MLGEARPLDGVPVSFLYLLAEFGPVFVEQAIFTSARTSRGSGYHLVAASPGLTDADARDLTRYGPSHDSLWESGAEALSVNFHRLSSGAYCVSQTTPEGPEYSNRGGARIYTQSLIVQPAAFARFANNPFAVLRTALALGVMQVHSEPPAHLEPVELFGHAAVIEDGLLSSCAAGPLRSKLGALIDAVIEGSSVALAVGGDGVQLLAAMIQALPVECRPEVTFSTGLRFSPTRSFQVCCLSANSLENRRLCRTYGMQLLEMDSADAALIQDGWGWYVTTLLEEGRLHEIIPLLQKPRPGLSLALLHELAASVAGGAEEPLWVSNNGSSGADRSQDLNHLEGQRIACLERTDAPHHSVGGVASTVPSCSPPAQTAEDPCDVLSGRFPLAVDQLQRLEDLIFESLAGRPHATDNLHDGWRRLAAVIDRRSIVEVRELYLRHTLCCWRELNDSDPQLSQARSEWALAILETLLAE